MKAPHTNTEWKSKRADDGGAGYTRVDHWRRGLNFRVGFAEFAAAGGERSIEAGWLGVELWAAEEIGLEAEGYCEWRSRVMFEQSLLK